MAHVVEMKDSSAYCDLCGLPLRLSNSQSILSSRTYHFCCAGCKQVFKMLLEVSGSPDPHIFRKTALFKKCQEMGIIPRSEADLDAKSRKQKEAASDEHIPDDQPHQETLSQTLLVRGMWCPACAWVIEEALKRIPGIVDVQCSFSTDRVRCKYNPMLTSPSRAIDSIEDLGYQATLAGQDDGSKGNRREFMRFVVSAFLAVNVMMLSFGLYSGFFTELSRNNVYRLSLPIAIMASVVLFYGGRMIYRRALNGISSAAFSMETLITTGAFSAYFYSTANLILGSLHLYYDTASMLITLVLMGKFLERKAKDRTQEALENFFSLRPTKVKICSSPHPEGRYVAVDQLRPGDLFRVENGEIVPADGPILEGSGTVNESSLTGEVLPVGKRPGDRLRSGTKVAQGAFKVRAEQVGQESTLGQMIEIMEKTLGAKTAFEGKTDRLLRWFVPSIVLLAVGTGFVYLLLGLSLDKCIIRAITVMVISCPCALGIAIPLARVAGISVAAKKGILVRDFSSFEQMEQVNHFVLDKTGTVTDGMWSLQEIVALEPFKERHVLALAASLESGIEHPIAAEIRRQAQKRKIKLPRVDQIQHFGNGLSGRIGEKEAKIGSGLFVAEAFERLDHEVKNAVSEEAEKSFVFMSLDGQPCAILVFGDRIKESSPATIQQLRNSGHRVFLISGDEEKTTQEIGRRIGVDEAYGRKLPKDKALFVKKFQTEGKRVAMVGDGINDAPALAQADLGIGVHSGNHLNKETSDITLMRGDPEQILDFMVLAKRVNRKIRQNLACAFSYNVISIPVAMAGLLTPLVAVCAMLMSSLCVIGNTLLLVRKS